MKTRFTASSFFVFDVESIGLHGEAFSVGGGVYLPNGAACWEFRFTCPMEEATGTAEDREWVKENCPPTEITHRTPKAMRNAFWGGWLQAKGSGAAMAADCGWPVESRFLASCVDDDPHYRRWEGPYPMLEISTLLWAVGRDPLGTHRRKASEFPPHDPLADARLSARLLAECIEMLPRLKDLRERT